MGELNLHRLKRNRYRCFTDDDPRAKLLKRFRIQFKCTICGHLYFSKHRGVGHVLFFGCPPCPECNSSDVEWDGMGFIPEEYHANVFGIFDE